MCVRMYVCVWVQDKEITQLYERQHSSLEVWASGLTLKLDLDLMCSYISRAVQVRLISRLISLDTPSYHA